MLREVVNLMRQHFQSHNGAIAALALFRFRFTISAFNPTMVRLLLDGRHQVHPICPAFQSHNGAIAAA